MVFQYNHGKDVRLINLPTERNERKKQQSEPPLVLRSFRTSVVVFCSVFVT